MIRPMMKGNVPDSTPALDQPMPLSRGDTGLDAGRDVVPFLGRRHLGTVRQALRFEDADRPLRAALPLADALARIVDVAVDVAAGQLHRRLRAALERDVDQLEVGGLLD